MVKFRRRTTKQKLFYSGFKSETGLLRGSFSVDTKGIIFAHGLKEAPLKHVCVLSDFLH